MSLDGSYAHSNVFARILRGELQCIKVYEDLRTLAFMDKRPRSEGHVVVVSKSSVARNILEIEPAELTDLIVVVQMVARAASTALHPDGIIVGQLNGRAAGQTIQHLHFHMIPTWKGQLLKGLGSGDEVEPGRLRELAGRIGRAMQTAVRTPYF